MSPAAFIHFGTTRELLHLMTEGMEQFTHLGWQARINTNSQEKAMGLETAISVCVQTLARKLYRGQLFCIMVRLSGGALRDLRRDAGWTERSGGYGTAWAKAAGWQVCCPDVRRLRQSEGSGIIWKKIGEPLWTAAVYPIRNTIQEAVSATLRAYEDGFPTLKDGISLKTASTRRM